MKTRQVICGAWLSCLTALVAQTTTLPEAVPGSFAPVPAKAGSGPELPAQPMEPKPATLSSCGNAAAVFKNLRIKLSDDQKKLLEKDRFLLLPIESTWLGEELPTSDDEKEWAFTSDEMLTAYTHLGGDEDPSTRKPYQTRLITPDMALHAWHKGFSRALEYIEQRRLHQLLTEFLEGSLDNARELRAKATGPAADRLAMTEARFAAAWVLLGPPAPKDPEPEARGDGEEEKPAPVLPSYSEVVKQRLTKAKTGLPEEAATALENEVTLILAEQGMKPSPLFGKYAPDKPADYTQFKPRSHYTKSDTLGGYFRAMMFLGRNGYELKNSDAIADAQLATLVMARTSAKGITPTTPWKQIMEITGFFAGQSDDITYTEFRGWLASTLGSPALDTASALSPENGQKLSANMGKLRAPMIVSNAHPDQSQSPDSDPKSFRIFGQRFTWDARVLDRLTRGSPDDMPTIPTAVMIPAALGDEQAVKISKQFLSAIPDKGAAYSAEFDKRLPEIRKELAGVKDADWFASMASKQLHVVSMLAKPRNANFPAFMLGDAFKNKNLVSMLGSYTQLKHDTVLYAKQNYAEAGEGGESDKIPPAPHGMVQPDVAFWREIERLAVFAADGFARHKLLPDGDEEFNRFRVFADDMKKFREIAEKDVAGAPLSDKDWEVIRTTDLTFMAKPILPYDEPKPGDGKCALVTDVLTDAQSGRVLQQALGRPHVMLTLAGGRHGNRLLVGLAYNYYEFARSLDKGRLTDEEWQAQVYVPQPKLPERNSWQPVVTKPTMVKPAE